MAALSAIITGRRSVSRRAAAARRDEHRDDEDVADGAQRHDDGQRDQDEQQQVEPEDRQAHRLGRHAVERVDQQLVVEEHDEQQHDRPPTIAESQMSFVVTPSTLPKRNDARSRVKFRDELISTTPSANVPANITPIAESSLTRRFVATTAIDAEVSDAEDQGARGRCSARAGRR